MNKEPADKSLPNITKILLSHHNIHLKKSLGQNMLVDHSALERIVSAADISKEDTVIEIGTGTGLLTKYLAEKAKMVISYEKDSKILEAAKDYLSEFKNIELINEDFLKIDNPSPSGRGCPDPIGAGEGGGAQRRVKVVANVPYYITSPIIEKIFEISRRDMPWHASTAILTVQREFARRIIARPNTKEYGSFTIFANYYSQPEIVSYIPKTSFIPQPDVSSAIIRLNIRKEPPIKIKDEKIFFAVVRAAFNQRRKTLHNALSAKFDKETVNTALLKSGIDPRRRGETLSMEEFAAVANNISHPTI